MFFFPPLKQAEKAKVIQSLLFASGLSPLFQPVFGTRLPVVAVSSYAYLIPITSIIQASRYSSSITTFQLSYVIGGSAAHSFKHPNLTQLKISAFHPS
ncbi:hypothetical protein SLE2022_116920 [Rubroshorea leprosula]